LGGLVSFLDRRGDVNVVQIRAVASAETLSFEFVKVTGEEVVASSKEKRRKQL